MSLKERILKEMVIDPLVIEIFDELPSELKTSEKIDEIQAKLRARAGGDCNKKI